MATKKNLVYLGGGDKVDPTSSSDVEFDESEIWNLSGGICDDVPKTSIFGSLVVPKIIVKWSDHANINNGRSGVTASSSLPVNVPDWSKILRGEYKNNNTTNDDDNDDDDNDDEDEWIPPHEYLARTRTSSMSVHEGIGRTLKGRDLRMVRNAIWKQIGFED